MDEYISRGDVFDIALQYCADDDGSCSKADVDLREMLDEIEALPASDVQPVIETENMATVSDEFICKKCGIYLKNYIKVVMDEDNEGYIDEQHYDYEPKYCPECGAEVRDCDTND